MSIARVIALTASAALLVTPSLAGAHGRPDHPGQPSKHATAPAPSTGTSSDQTDAAKPVSDSAPDTSAASKRKAHGKLCAKLSKKHVKGHKGTPFSQCVVALAQFRKGEKRSARQACAKLSKKHVKGQKGTPFSECIRAIAKLRKEACKKQQAGEQQSGDKQGETPATETEPAQAPTAS